MSTEYTVSNDPSRFDLPAIHAFLSTTYWSPGIPLQTVKRAVENSLSFGLFFGKDQVGFARVISDKATFAYLADVYVLEEHRGKGLSKLLLEAVQSHGDLQGLRRFMLATRDAQGLYAQFGFRELLDPSRMMERLNPNAYQSTL